MKISLKTKFKNNQTTHMVKSSRKTNGREKNSKSSTRKYKNTEKYEYGELTARNPQWTNMLVTEKSSL